MAGTGLVVSPFVPRRSDAGHRKRAFEACLLLRDLGYRLTLVHLAFEGAWFWRRQAVDHAELAECGIEEYHEIYADDIVGRAPRRDGGLPHQLDEWWHPALEAFLANHLRRHHYEIAVVHNVWLSKVFDLLPLHTTRLIETHDVFSVRDAQFARIGARPDYFSCSESDEVFGLRRAQLAIAIKEDDRAWFTKKAGIDAVTVAPRPTALDAAPDGYRHPEKVIVGFMGSDHAFNVHCLRQFLDELRHRLRLEPAALEMVIAGTVSAAIDLQAHPYVRSLGFVADVEDFYRAVDVVVSPLDHGTGVKIKVAEAVDRALPVLATAHSAEGTSVDRTMIEPNKAALAARVVAFAAERPDIGAWQRRARAARNAAVAAYAQSRDQLHRQLLKRRRRVVLHLPELLLPAHHPLRAVAICTLRTYAGQGSVFVLVPKGHRAAYERLLATMPASVRPVEAETGAPDAAAVFVDVVDESLAALFEGAALHTSVATVRSLHAHTETLDERFVLDGAAVPDGAGTMRVRTRRGRPCEQRIVLPLYSDALCWDPNLRPPVFAAESEPTTFVRMPAATGERLRRYVRAHHTGHGLVTYGSDRELSDALPRLLGCGRLGRHIHFASAVSPLELALVEYLKATGAEVACGLGFLARGDVAAARPASAQQAEAPATRFAVEFMCTMS